MHLGAGEELAARSGDRLCHAEVGEDKVASLRDEDVVGLDIAMNYTKVVKRLDCNEL